MVMNKQYRYDKLVRDHIIDIIKKGGGSPVFHTAETAEYLVKLKEKLREETEEFISSETEEEMADIFEVIYALLALKGWSIEEIVSLQKKKREERGGFEKKIILEEA